jgi:multimeric flavodoxin WrbA
MPEAPKPRKGQGSVQIPLAEFKRRLSERFYDPAFDAVRGEIDRVIEVAWKNYDEYHKSPRKRKAGRGFADPQFELPIEWLETRRQIRLAERRRKDPKSRSRILLVCGAARHDQTCPGEMSKSFRLAGMAREVIAAARGFECDFLDLSMLTAQYGKQILPCKACVSTAMPLCHWPCSCYPNHAMGQVGDWMNEIYPRWAATHGKDPAKAKALELKGWDYPRHLAGRLFSVVVHGDTEGTDTLRRSLTDWLLDIGLEQAGASATLDRYIGYYEPYATSHLALDRDRALHDEVRGAASTLVRAVALQRSGKLVAARSKIREPRPK